MTGAGPTSARLSWRIERQPTCCVVAFAGELDESADLAPLAAQLSGPVIFDVDGLRRINSDGVHRWVSFVRDLPAVTDLSFVRCRQAFITQINLIYGFAGRGSVATMYVPFLCDPCGRETLELLEVEALRGRPIPAIACSSCGAAMELDEDPVRYFAFLSW